MAIRCPESWSTIAPRVELELLAEALADDEVRVLVSIAARLVRDRLFGRVVASVDDILLYVVCNLLGRT